MAPLVPSLACEDRLVTLSEQLVPFPRCPGPCSQGSFSPLKYQLRAERPETPLTLLGRWGWHLGRWSQERISNQAAGRRLRAVCPGQQLGRPLPAEEQEGVGELLRQQEAGTLDGHSDSCLSS